MTNDVNGSAASDCYAVPPHLIMDVIKMERIAMRLKRAEHLLKRAYDGMHKDHWAEGESETEVCKAINDHFANFKA